MIRLFLLASLSLFCLGSFAGALPSPEKLCFDNCEAAGGSVRECLAQCGYDSRALIWVSVSRRIVTGCVPCGNEGEFCCTEENCRRCNSRQ